MEQTTYTPARAPSSARFPKRRAAIMHVLQFCRKTNRAAPKFLDAARLSLFQQEFFTLGAKPQSGIYTRPAQRGPAWQHSHACARVMGARWPGAAHHPQKMPMARVRQMPCPLRSCRWHPPNTAHGRWRHSGIRHTARSRSRRCAAGLCRACGRCVRRGRCRGRREAGAGAETEAGAAGVLPSGGMALPWLTGA